MTTDLRRTRNEIRIVLDEAHTELAELDTLPPDDFEVGTVLQFKQGETVWLARKTDEKDDNDGNPLWNVGSVLDSYERLFPINIKDLQVFVLRPDLVWETPEVSKTNDSFFGDELRDTSGDEL